MNTPSRGYPPGDLRVSDAERDRAVSELSEHFQAGRLTAEEFDERSGQALRARTGADLACLFTDLPREQDPIEGPVAGPGGVPPRLPSLAAARIAVAVIACAVFISLLGAGRHSGNGLAALFPIISVLLIVRLLVLRGRRRGLASPILAASPSAVRTAGQARPGSASPIPGRVCLAPGRTG
jgi:hypothetical protein